VKRADLLILGGGPAGATLAGLAADAGARVLLLERHAFPRDKPCGEFLSVEGRGVLERLGVLGTLLDLGATWMDSVRVTSLGGHEVTASLPHLPGLGRLALGVSRRALDATLLLRAQSAGACVMEQAEAVLPIVEGGRVMGVRFRRVGSAGPEESALARVVVAADGRRSFLVRTLHPRLGDPCRSFPGSWFGLKAHMDADPARLERRVELHLFNGGYAGLSSVEGSKINLCLLVTVRALRGLAGSPDRLLHECILENPAIRDRLARASRCSPWKSIGPLRFGPRRATAAGALLVGDAAGTVDPFCGEGIAHALRGAEIALPFALEGAARGRLTSDLAAGYRDAWHRAFGPATRRVRWLGRLLQRHRPAGQVIRAFSRMRGQLVTSLVASTRTGLSAVSHLERLTD